MKDYTKSLEGSLGRVSDESGKITSQRKFDKASDDPVNAMKALRTYRQLATVDQYQSSVSETSAWVQDTEYAVNTVNTVLMAASSTLIAAKGTSTASDLQNHAKSLDSYQTELLNTLNSTFNGQYVFGGKDSGCQPFKMGTSSEADLDSGVPTGTDVNGKLLYNIPNTDKYVPVSMINNNPGPTAQYSINNPAMKYSMPVDIGLGISTDPTTHNVINGTAFDASTSALDFVCQNITSAGCDNIIDTLGTTSTQMKAGDSSGIGAAQDAVKDAQSLELKATVTIGEKSKLLGFMSNKLTNDNTNLTTRLSAVEDIDVTAEYSKYLVDQQVYNASLSVGSNILQHSLFDFLK